MKRIISKVYRLFHPVRNIGIGNVIEVASKMRGVKIDVNGNNNLLQIGTDCVVSQCNISISGDNNILIIEDKARLLGGARIIMEGNAIIKIGANAGVRKVDFLAKDARIDVGELCMFSNNIIVRTHDSHKVIDSKSGEVINKPKDVILGRHVWIGQNVTILKGCNIGDNSILALGAVVTKSCPSNCIMAGSPAKIVKTEVIWDY